MFFAPRPLCLQLAVVMMIRARRRPVETVAPVAKTRRALPVKRAALARAAARVSIPRVLRARPLQALAPKQALQLGDPDLRAVNTRQNPDRVAPRPLTSVRTDGERLEAVLAPASWNVIQLAVSD